MSSDPINLTAEDLDGLGARLDAADLTEKDKQILVAAFTIAGQVVSAGDEVSGFTFRSPSSFSAESVRSKTLRQGLSTGFQSSLSNDALGEFKLAGIIIMVGF